MFTGVIRTRDVIRHPLIIIRTCGLSHFLKILMRALSPKDYHYVESAIETVDQSNVIPMRRRIHR